MGKDYHGIMGKQQNVNFYCFRCGEHVGVKPEDSKPMMCKKCSDPPERHPVWYCNRCGARQQKELPRYFVQDKNMGGSIVICSICATISGDKG